MRPTDVLRIIARWLPAAAVCAAACVAVCANAGATSSTAEWQFTVRLDGKTIGSHRFVLDRAGPSSTLRSAARFDVTLLGLPLYRYRHESTERWSEGCLASIDARTEDNGRRTDVRGQTQGARFELQVRGDSESPPATSSAAGCLMSFAYWHAALATQTRLLDPGSGRVEPVVVGVPPVTATDLDAAAGPLRGLRIGGLAQPIDVWYAGERWVGLDTVVGGGRRLSYRLR